MEKDSLLKLLQASQIPNTEQVKAVTAELQKNYYTQPVSLLLLVDIALTNEDAGIRKLASGQAIRLLHKHWESVTDDQKSLARKHLLEGTLKETVESNRNTLARLLSGIAHLDLDNKKGHDLLESILALNNSDDVTAREVGSYIVHDLVETDPTNFEEDLDQLFALLERNIRDPKSKAVRINAIKTLWSVLMLIEAEDTAHVAKIQAMIPPCVETLKQAVSEEDEQAYSPIFETLSLFLSYDPVFLSAHFADLLHFVMEIASNREVTAEARSQAIDFLSQCARFRRLKLQAMKDMPAYLITKAMAIITEQEPDEDEDEDDDDDNHSPSTAARILIDTLSGSLPPRLVMVPLLDEFAKYAVSPDPAFRRASILGLGVSAEGAPDFLATQIDSIVPKIVTLLVDADSSVRTAALNGLAHMANHLAEPLGKHHETIIGAILQNLEAATNSPSNKRNITVIRYACSALDSLGDGIDKEEMGKYGSKLIVPMGKLLSHDDYGVKAAAAGAIGAIAESLGRDFHPYFGDVMTALAPYVLVKDTPEALALRSSSCDTMGRIATAVGADAFQPYVMDLMKASEEAMSLESDRLKETSFMLWSAVSKVYAEHFAPFLPGVFASLFETLELEERVVSLPGELTIKDCSGDKTTTVIIGGKKLTIKESDGGGDIMDQDDDDDDDSDFDPITGVALEQEAAIDTLADVITNSCDANALHEYVKRALDKLEPLTEHSYEGVRKNAITACWRIYARVWAVWEQQTGQKWQRGLHLNPEPDATLVKIAAVVEKCTMRTWVDDPEQAVIYEINNVVANTLRACGPAILLTKPDMLDDVIKNTEKVLMRTHSCQQDLGDDDDEREVGEDSSEIDWMVIDSALEVITGLAAALGPDFLGIWKRFEQPIMKFVSSSTDLERSTAVGVVAEVIKFSGPAISEYTRPLMALLKRRLGDPGAMIKSNAIYGLGQLIDKSTDTEATLAVYQELWESLEPLLTHESGHLVDNVYGCLSRMMLRNPDQGFVAEVLPKITSRLPVKTDYEENEPIFSNIYKLYEQGNPTVRQLTPSLLPVFQQVLSPPEEQLQKDTREVVRQTVHILSKSQPALLNEWPNLLHLAGLA